jgi:predicted peptidase
MPAPLSQAVAITAGDTGSASVTYSAPSGLPALAPGYYSRSVTISAAQAGGTAQTYGYQIYIPTGYTPTRAWPIILTSSGSGEFGTNNTSQVGVGLGPHVGALGEQAIVVFPQWHSSPSVAGLRSLMEVTALRQTMGEVHADSTRLYATGNSSGGFQVWETLYRYPTLFAAGVSAAGGVNFGAVGQPSVASEVDALLAMPTWIFSADDDGTVPTATYFTPIVNGWTAKGSLGTLHQYTLYHAIGGHQPTWDTAFASAATWTWLFAQHR